MNRYLKIATVLICTVTALSAWAGPPYTTQMIGGNGGYGVTTQSEWLMVGEPEICRVHVYKLDYDTMLYGDGDGTPGVEFQTLAPDAGNGNCDNVKNRGYGEVVSIDGDLLVVGAPDAKGAEAIALYGETLAADDGSVFLYEYDGTSWTQLAQTFEARNDLGEPLNQEGAEFGSAVAIDGDLMAIGSRAEGTAFQGALYIYRVNRTLNTATQVAKLTGVNPGDTLGWSVTIWEEQILAGVPGYDIPGSPSIVDGGAAYLYEMDGNVPVPDPDNPITTHVDGWVATPLNVGKEVSNGEFIGLLAGQTASYPVERNELDEVVPKFEYTRSAGGDVSQSEGVSAFGIFGEGVDIYPDVLNDNAAQRENYHLEIDLSGAGTSTGMAEDIKIYKEFVAVNDNSGAVGGQVQVLQFPCNYGGELTRLTYELVTVPCNVPPGTTVEQAFNADIFPGACSGTPCGVLGRYGTNWVVYGQNDDFTSPQPTVLLSASTPVQPGKGYWIVADASKKPAGQPVYWNVDESIFTSPASARIPLTTGSNPRGGALAPDVGGYYEVDLPTNIPTSQTVGVLLGNPFGRSFRWSQTYVQLQGLINQAFLVGTVNLVNPLFSVNAYIYNPDSTEGQPYDTVATTPGFSEVIPVNKGFWIRMRHGGLTGATTFRSLWLPYSK